MLLKYGGFCINIPKSFLDIRILKVPIDFV